jgi:hypothetical protein
VEGAGLAGQEALLNSHYRLLWLHLLVPDIHKGPQVVEQLQDRQPGRHTGGVQGQMPVWLWLSYAGCIQLVGQVPAGMRPLQEDSILHLTRGEERENCRRHIPERSNDLQVAVPLPRSLVQSISTMFLGRD